MSLLNNMTATKAPECHKYLVQWRNQILNPHGAQSSDSIDELRQGPHIDHKDQLEEKDGNFDTIGEERESNGNANQDKQIDDILGHPEAAIAAGQILALILAGPIKVESDHIEVDKAQSSQNGDKVDSEQLQVLDALRPQHPFASPTLGKLASKNALPARMRRQNIPSFLEPLGHDNTPLNDTLDNDRTHEAAPMTEGRTGCFLRLGSLMTARNSTHRIDENSRPPLPWSNPFAAFQQSLIGRYEQTIQRSILLCAPAGEALLKALLSQAHPLKDCSFSILPLVGIVLFNGGVTASPTRSMAPVSGIATQATVTLDVQWSWHLVIFTSSFAWIGCSWGFERKRSTEAKNYELWFSFAAFLYHLAYGYKAFVEERLDSATRILSAGLTAIGFTAAWTSQNTRRMSTMQRQLLTIGTVLVVLGLDCYLLSTMSSSDPAKSFMALLVPCIAGATFFLWALRTMSAHVVPLLS